MILHDFDKSGFSIAGTLQHDTRRYRFVNPPEIIDFGLRLADIESEGLDPEPVSYQERDPRANLRENGATKAEIDFLYTGGGEGQRVELNALPSDRLVLWIERKLADLQVKKVVPEEEILVDAYHRAAYVNFMNKRIKELHDPAVAFAKALEMPKGLRDRIGIYLEEHPEVAWDMALAEFASEALNEETSN